MSQRLFINKFFTFIAPQVRGRISVLQCKRNKISMNMQCLCRNTSNYNKAISPQQPVDLLMQNIRSATDTSDVLYYVQQHHAIMNDAHIALALHSVFILQKSQKSTFTNGELVKHESFQLLCKLLQQKIRFLELNDHLNALKVMSFVGVPSAHKIIQILLQLVSKQVNELSLQQIVFLDFILKDFESCPLVDALRIALPIVFEAHFRLQKEGCDMKQLSEFFAFAIKRKLSDKCINVFVNTMFENRSNLDVESSKTILRTLCDAKKSEMPYRTLLHQCLDNVVDNINNFTFLDLNYILSRLTSNYNNKNGSYFYHEEFINSCANYVIDKNCDDEQITWVLKSCNKFKHMHKQILDRLSDRIAENPDRLEKWSAGMFVSFIRGLSIADYRPNNFSVYEEYLIDNLLKLTSKLELPWLRTALHLCSLDCWPYELFDTIFEENFLDRFLKRGNSGDSHDLLHLYQAIVTLCPAYKGNMPSPNVINKVINKVKLSQDNFKSPLLPSLIQGLGGPSYVFSSLHTKLGHFVDHAVVMRKGGYFVSINIDSENSKSTVIVEDIPLPEDSQLALILYILPRSYTLNTERIQGETRLSINTLEAMGFSVVPVLESVWVNLLDSEKIPYLMQALQNKSVTQENIAASQT